MTSPNTIIADMQAEIDSLKSAIEDSQDIASKALRRAVAGHRLDHEMNRKKDDWFCDGCGKYRIFDADTSLCWQCKKDHDKHASDYDATTEDIGYGKVQQARAERERK